MCRWSSVKPDTGPGSKSMKSPFLWQLGRGRTARSGDAIKVRNVSLTRVGQRGSPIVEVAKVEGQMIRPPSVGSSMVVFMDGDQEFRTSPVISIRVTQDTVFVETERSEYIFVAQPDDG